MPDTRSLIFSDLHRTWLKPLGFRKTGRKSVKELERGLIISVVLESYPAPPAGPYRFSIDTHASIGSGTNRIAYTLVLPTYLNKGQYWAIDDATNTDALHAEVIDVFGAVAVPALQKMQRIEGLAELFGSIPDHIPLFWYYTSYFNCLKLLNRRPEALALLERTIALAPHEGVAQQARKLLVEYK